MAQGIIDALRRDHQEVRKMLARLETAGGKQRRELFQRLVAELVPFAAVVDRARDAVRDALKSTS